MKISISLEIYNSKVILKEDEDSSYDDHLKEYEIGVFVIQYNNYMKRYKIM